MVVVKQGPLPPPGKQYKVYLNVDKLKQKWYLRVTHTYSQYNQHFRAGTYKSREDALKALENLDPTNPKKGRQRKGTVDQYNGQWRVRAKHRGEHMHVGYFKDREKAEKRLKEVIADTDFLEKRYNSLIAKRKRKRESMKTVVTIANGRPVTSLRRKVKKMQRKQRRGYPIPNLERGARGDSNPFGSMIAPVGFGTSFDEPAQPFTSSDFTSLVTTNPLLERCINCGDAAFASDAHSDERPMYFRCDRCKFSDIGWCAPALLTDHDEVQLNFPTRSKFDFCASPTNPPPVFHPRSFKLNSPITYE